VRLLAAHPGADWATSDVFNGYTAALGGLGHEVGSYNLHVRIGRAGEWLEWNWRKAVRAGQDAPKPSAGDTIYLASADAVAAALRGNVDWVLVFTGAYFHPDALIMLRRAGRRVALFLTESPYEDHLQAKLLPLADVVFCNERTSLNRLRLVNPNVVYLPPAYDPLTHTPSPAPAAWDDDVPAHDVVFVGTGFQERLDALAAVNWDGIDLGLYGEYALLGSRSGLRRHIRAGTIPNALTAALYRKAKIGLNLYRRSIQYARDGARIDTAESVNPRAVELAACGVFTISDRRAEATEQFGDLVPTFDTPADLEPLLRRWLADDRGRRTAAEGLPGVVARSTFRHRAERVLEVLAFAQARMGEHTETVSPLAAAALGHREVCDVA
jgi:hypothetical protein